MLLRVFILVISICSFGQAIAKDSVFPEKMSSKKWRVLFLRSFPNDFCAEDDYFYNCYLSNKNQCVQFVRPLTIQCLDKAKMNNEVKWPQEGLGLGMSVGACVAKRFLTKYDGKKRDIEKCKPSRQW